MVAIVCMTWSENKRVFGQSLFGKDFLFYIYFIFVGGIIEEHREIFEKSFASLLVVIK